MAGVDGCTGKTALIPVWFCPVAFQNRILTIPPRRLVLLTHEICKPLLQWAFMDTSVQAEQAD